MNLFVGPLEMLLVLQALVGVLVVVMRMGSLTVGGMAARELQPWLT